MKCAILYDNSIYIIEHEDSETLNTLANEWEATVTEMYKLNVTTYVAIYRDMLGIPLDATMAQERATVLVKYGKSPINNKKFLEAMQASVERFNESKMSYPEPIDWFISKGCTVWKADRVVKVAV